MLNCTQLLFKILFKIKYENLIIKTKFKKWK
jgi:hypothetical protein